MICHPAQQLNLRAKPAFICVLFTSLNAYKAGSYLGGMTVGEYFALPDQERERIWGELYVEAIESAPDREVNPNAIVPARQKHRSRDR